MSNQAYIIQLCKQLADEGKTPSLALIRNKADRSLAIPEVIDGLKRWKDNPEHDVEEDTTTNENEQKLSLEQRVEQLELQVKSLTSRLTALEK